MTEIWLQTALSPVTAVADQAHRYEADGWDGVMVFDSQCLIADPYVVLALAAASTQRIGLGIGVSNPVTRHASVTANAIAAVHQASGGRAVLGIGRGNSSTAYLGAAPATLAQFGPYLRLLQALLAGEAAPVAMASAQVDEQRSLDPHGLGRAPDETRLQWLDGTVSKVPVEVAATGPKAIALGARLGDRVSFSVGASKARLSEAVGLSRASNPDLKLTAYVSVAALEDLAAARNLAAPDVAMHAQIAATNAANLSCMSDEERRTAEAIAQAYDMTRHGRHGAQTAVMDDSFIDANAVVGAPEHCVERLRNLADVGLDRLVLMLAPPRRGSAGDSYARIVKDVLPHLRE